MSLILTQGALPNDALGQLFSEARTYAYWQDKPVEDETLRHLYELMKFAPTSVNCSPLRIKFLRTDDAKAKLDPALSEGNRHKVHAAPVTAILAYDRGFHRHLPELFPHADAKSWFVGNEPYREETAFRNSSLQGGYFILAARALGLDAGPLSGFDNDMVDGLFFAEGDPDYRSNFLCNLGYGDSSKLYPRSPRLAFEQVCEFL
ncbi:malonic semialdehyde reductase [Halomonas sp. ATBC28]|uniref:malonic semialdehyde reductase n=1 Tax=unclassified Halomonas TaxID=2609666 RepID=UPI00110D9F84|nr:MULTISPECIES: malonic semialdehyde reductase [unclassified Halomonas]MCA8862836.1 malonic semialdehyde reductase [Halomonas sp. SBBP1]TMU18131.1 malonic semialdehyde reductase [Halomonas sp. ATBC28]